MVSSIWKSLSMNSQKYVPHFHVFSSSSPLLVDLHFIDFVWLWIPFFILLSFKWFRRWRINHNTNESNRIDWKFKCEQKSSFRNFDSNKKSQDFIRQQKEKCTMARTQHCMKAKSWSSHIHCIELHCNAYENEYWCEFSIHLIFYLFIYYFDGF